jgi:hypothetical protein
VRALDVLADSVRRRRVRQAGLAATD